MSTDQLAAKTFTLRRSDKLTGPMTQTSSLVERRPSLFVMYASLWSECASHPTTSAPLQDASAMILLFRSLNRNQSLFADSPCPSVLTRMTSEALVSA